MEKTNTTTTVTPTPWYKRRRTWILAIVVVAIILVVRQVTKPATKATETATVSRGTVKEELVLSGEIKAVEDASLPFSTSGSLSWVGVHAGIKVTKGQPLMKLDTFKLNSIYQRASAAYRLTQATVDKVHDNLKDKGNSESFTEKETRTAAEVANDQAYEAYISAQKDLRDATLIAPFAGIVTYVSNEVPGVNVTVGVTQVKVVNPSSIYFSVNADQSDVSKLALDRAADITLDAYTDAAITGKISEISFTPSEFDSGTVYPIRILISADNSQYKYRVGMTGDARFTLSEKENALSVPNKYIKSDKQGKYVLIGDGKTKKYVELGIEGEDRVEIKTDLTEGTVVYN
ncbi:efflux RND transporter periplasmic adaptor subunit [Candidatus Woesebacteria bacterium]|jgi:RND family efflux transporter MFP subunit|nr:efflux RND transporter periplasmic adaptor subunit [Candidatus Woesebacteria bacterium]MBP9687551.1 efflux RND transporter periplasmic adaptor subunit [Candidatus Woesebacteria bacterium]